MKLSNGVILDILNGNGIIPKRMVFQLIATRKVEIQSANEPHLFNFNCIYRLQISDGDYIYNKAVLSPRLNKLMSGYDITNKSVIEVTKIDCYKVADDKPIIIIFRELSVLVKGGIVGGIIGTPVLLNVYDIPPLPARPNNSHEAAGKTSVKMEYLGQEENADYFITTKGTVVFAKKENCMYKACPTAECNMKVVDRGNGLYRCEKCNKEFPNYKWRMYLSFDVADPTDNQLMICFQDSAEDNLKAN